MRQWILQILNFSAGRSGGGPFFKEIKEIKQ